MGWLMEQGKNQGPMYVLMILLLGGSGLNLNKSSDIDTNISDINRNIGAISEWKAVAEYRITELEKGE